MNAAEASATPSRSPEKAEEIAAALVRACVGFLGSTALLVVCMIGLAAR